MALGRRIFVVATLATFATWTLSLSGCRNRKEEARQKAELTAALDQFKAQNAELVQQAAALRARFDKLPEDLPGIQPVRDDLHALEEGLGVEDGRGKWLAGELDKAFASGKKQDIDAVRKLMPHGDGGMTQMIVKVAHEMAPLERLAAQRQFFEKLDAAKARDGASEKTPKAR
jgi:hypothetical protein